jgi:hypothetical protein
MTDEDASPSPGRTAANKPGSAIQEAPSARAPVPGAVIINPGSPVAWWLLPPGTPSGAVSVGRARMIVGGTGEPLQTDFHFVGQLGQAIDVTSVPGLRWSAIHSLGFDPWGSMSFRLTPHELKHGQLYDLRFLSRDKTARSKKDVLALLVSMGFSPATIFLSKRNMRVPGRPLTTLSEWFGVGVWTGPDSVIVSSDPFYFAEVRPTS